MIVIQMDGTGIRAEGHADAGQEKVCAGVTAIFGALALGLDSIGEIDELDMKGGLGSVTAICHDDKPRTEAGAMIRMAREGLAMIAKAHPDQVRTEIIA